MDRTLTIIPEAIYSEADGLYHCGPGVGASHADAVADAMMLGAFLSPVTDGTSALRYDLMLDVSADPEEQDGPSEEGGEGGPSEPPDIWSGLSREYLAEVDHLCRCADGQHILDWAYPDALAAYVARGLRDCWHPMLGERVQVWPSGDVGVLLAVDELGYLIVDGSTRICLPRERVERLGYPLSAGTPAPATSPAPAGTRRAAPTPEQRTAWFAKQDRARAFVTAWQGRAA